MSAEVPCCVCSLGAVRCAAFDRTEKFQAGRVYVSTRIDNLALDVFERLVEARYQRDREPTLRQINLDIEKLRLCYDSAMSNGFDDKAFVHARESLRWSGA